MPLPTSSGVQETAAILSRDPEGGLASPFLDQKLRGLFLSKTRGTGFRPLLPPQDSTLQMVTSLYQSLLACQCGLASLPWESWGPLP